jgi:hypothetical protein
MSMKSISLALCLVSALLLASGCKKSETGETAADAGQLVAQIHWLGMDRVASETNAASFLTIWREPESRKLLSQTLHKLADWMSGATNSAISNPRLVQGPNAKPAAESSPLRPVLDDLVQAESYLEVRQTGGGPGELRLAVRLTQERAALWETNLAAAVQASTGARPVIVPGTYGWQAELSSANSAGAGGKDRAGFLRLSKSGDWTLLCLARDSKVASLPASFTPPPAGTNFWIQGDIDLARVEKALALDWKLPSNAPRINFNVIGDGENLISRGELNFAQPLGLALRPWNIPTNLIQGNLISLTAVRGVGPWLGKLALFSKFPPANLPDQMFVWGRGGVPFDVFYALSVSNAAEALNDVAGPITNWANPRILPNDGSITLDPKKHVLSWGVPHAQPFLRAEANAQQQYLYGGFAPEERPTLMPPELQEHILEGTNLVYFNWEVAGQMLIHWRYLDDVYRLVFDSAGPRLNGTASLQWVATNLTNLTHTVTEARLESPTQLSFVRKSTVGFNGLEIDVLANWLEMRQFPRGLDELMATNNAPIRIHVKQHKPRQTAPAQPAPGATPH